MTASVETHIEGGVLTITLNRPKANAINVATSQALYAAFAMLEHLGRVDQSLDGVDELAGLGLTRPLAAAVVAVCMFSLAGVPPLAGFWGKLTIFGVILSLECIREAKDLIKS